jgi:hypothetical protein
MVRTEPYSGRESLNSMNGDGRWNVGDFLHLLQIAMLLITIGAFYEKMSSSVDMMNTHSQQLNRIEHYLSGKDSHYWDDSRKSE